ncbi:hypothetical protein [Streptomyces afghaniensis]|uniref:hypothetical protein n=1 Tax=Streptomyces afghaniensis TaxID=66865 RepID=UPI00277D6DC5|nr:hypothetical protein [Streptomyces afghaniensis]MDQ1022286.1 hypothetical protein [Streptomyces afghaniensis]
MPAAVVCGAGSVENSPSGVRVAGRAVLLIPHRSDAADEGALPRDYRKVLAIVREADGPVQVRAVGERLARTPLCAASWSRCGRR